MVWGSKSSCRMRRGFHLISRSTYRQLSFITNLKAGHARHDETSPGSPVQHHSDSCSNPKEILA